MNSFVHTAEAGVKRIFIVLLVWFVAGCVSAPEKKPVDEQAGTFIQLKENESVDAAVRKDFETALQQLSEEHYDEAIQILEKVIKTSQNNSAPYINIAIAYRKTGKIDKAEENLKKAMEINPLHPVTLNEYALLYRETGRYAEAKELYQALLKQYPEFTPARKNFGILCELYLNDKECAITQYEVYLGIKPDDEDVKLWLAGLQR